MKTFLRSALAVLFVFSAANLFAQEDSQNWLTVSQNIVPMAKVGEVNKMVDSVFAPVLNQLADEGKSIIVVSSELPELLGMCDRIIVMHEGFVKGEITDPSNATQEDILNMAIA